MQPLFIESEFQKVAAAEVSLPEDPSTWPVEIHQELFKQLPYVSDFAPSIIMDKVDGERGYALGRVEVSNRTEMPPSTDPAVLAQAGVQTVRLPIIVNDRKLQPFDIIMLPDGKIVPVSESRLRQALFRPQPFDVTSKSPGDQSLVGQLYPPYRQNYGYGGGGFTADAGMGKMGAAEKLAISVGKVRDVARRTGEKALDWAHSGPRGNSGWGAYPTTQERLSRAGADVADRAWKNQDKGLLLSAAGKEEQARKRLAITTGLTEGFEGKVAALESAAKTCSKCGMEKCACMGKTAAHPALQGATAVPVPGDIGNWVEHDVSAFLPPGHRMMVHPEAHQELLAMGDLSPEKTSAWFEKHRGKKILIGVDRGAAPGMGKTGSVLSALQRARVAAPAVEEFSKQASAALVQHELRRNPNAAEVFKVASSLSATSLAKSASALPSALPPTAMQVVKADEGYTIKAANHAFWFPFEEHVDRGQLFSRFGGKIALAADTAGSVTMTEDPVTEDPVESQPRAVTEFGAYQVQADGQPLEGLVFPNVLDLDGTPMPMALFVGAGTTAFQSEIAGIPAGDAEGAMGSLPMSPNPSGSGVFIRQTPVGMEATIPIEVASSMTLPDGSHCFQAVTFDGRQVMVDTQDGLEAPMVAPDGKFILPKDFSWVSLNNAKHVSLVSSPDDVVKEGSALPSVELRALDPDHISLRGGPVQKLAFNQREFASRDDALFILASLGVSPVYAQEKMAESLGCSMPVRVFCKHELEPVGHVANEARTKVAARKELSDAVWSLRRVLVKEAAVLPEAETVDSILSLGFLTPDNVATFIDYLPALEESVQKLCNLLLATRLGLSGVPQGAVEKACKTLNEVIDGLKMIAFSSN